METVQIIALSMGVAWASGINLYAAIATLGILGATGSLDLPPDLEVLQSPAVIAAAGFMYCVEFFADKVPWAFGGYHPHVDLRFGLDHLEMEPGGLSGCTGRARHEP